MDANSATYKTPNGAGKLSTPTNKPTSGNTKMSASLKEKLRKLGRYHGNTPSASVSPPKTSSMIRIIDVTDRLSTTPVPVIAGREGDGVRPPPQRRLNLRSQPLKRKLVNDEDDDHLQKLVGAPDVPPLTRPPVFDSQLKVIRENIEECEEELRKLRLVKLYRTKNDLDALERSIDKWRKACQGAVTELYEKSIATSNCADSKRLKLAELLGHLQINLDLVRYDADDEDFY